MASSRRLVLWLVLGSIAIGLGFFILYPIVITRLPFQRFTVGLLASACFLTGIAISEGLVWLISRKLTKTPNGRSDTSPLNNFTDFTNISKSSGIKSIWPQGPRFNDSATKRHTETSRPVLAKSTRSRLAWSCLGSLAIVALVLLVVFAITERNRTSLKAVQHNANVAPKEDDLLSAIARKPAELRTALNAYQKLSADIHWILSEGLERRHIGGAVVIATANWQWNRERKTFKMPDQLGFERVSNPNALVNQVIRGEAAIKDIEIARASEKRYSVKIHVINLTGDFLKCGIDKGQLLEMEDGKNRTETNANEGTQLPQTAAASDEKRDGIYVIPPSQEGTIEFIAYCVNENLAAPNGSANLAIYKLMNTNFINPDQLHANMRATNRV